MASHLVNKVAPTQMYNPQTDAKGHVDYTFTIGKLGTWNGAGAR